MPKKTNRLAGLAVLPAALAMLAASQMAAHAVAPQSAMAAETTATRTVAGTHSRAHFPAVGQVWNADFGTTKAFGRFAAKITYTSGSELTFVVTKGALKGATDTVQYNAKRIANGVWAVTWHENVSGAYMTHIENFNDHTVLSSIVAGTNFIQISGSFKQDH